MHSIYHRQQCTLYAFEWFGSLYMHSPNDKHPAQPIIFMQKSCNSELLFRNLFTYLIHATIWSTIKDELYKHGKCSCPINAQCKTYNDHEDPISDIAI